MKGGTHASAKRGPQRGGNGGPCNHCACTLSPCWRKGPPDKPLLCNACGAHYLVKKSLDGYKPGQKSQRSSPKAATSLAAKARKEQDSEAHDILLHSSVGTSALSLYGAELIGDASAAGDEKDVSSGSKGKRKRTANTRYTDSKGAVKCLASRKPQGLSIRRVSRQDSDVTIADTPMAVNLLADMAGRRKTQAPPPIWELTSPRGIEEARSRTFNALMRSPRPVKHPVPRVPHPTGPSSSSLHVLNKGISGNIAPPPGTSAMLLGSALLPSFPYTKKTAATGLNSPVTMVRMMDIISPKSWAASAAAYPEECRSLSRLLPDCDRSSGDMVSPAKLFRSPAFAAALDHFQSLASAGMFDAEGGNVPAKVVDHYKRLFKECDLAESLWALGTPLTGKQRRLAKQNSARNAALCLPGLNHTRPHHVSDTKKPETFVDGGGSQA